ncbi:redoxin domain-containing protein [Parvibaculum sedimenti]|uniref:Redoxin domain-containing protein n=1 Tax=Parvibaculum sedimenti TaxID=2608632 RepID=A0A6N6VLR5_9HYPH|nr:SCO family protein [Parvibaculum sedimenti]KAB7742653.1 redoxin domain-containing protein [Parvibaculum sedimenti]
MTRQRLIILIAALAVAAIIGLALAPKVDRLVDNTGPNGEAGANVQSVGKPRVGGPFTLVDQTGKTVTDKDFQGKYMLIYFGFTFCPDVCPTELQVISGALEKLGDKAANVQPIFVSVDPDRDTPEVLAKYVKQFDPRLIGLTGSAEQIAAVAKAYRVFYEKVKEQPADGSKAADADYTVDHSSVAYLMGPNGEFLTFFPPGVSPDQMAEKIASYL